VNEKTVLRAGYGISVDPYPFSRAMRDPYPVTIAQTISSTSTYIAAGTLTAGIPPVAPIDPINGMIPLPIDAYTKTLPPGTFTRGYIESFNATVERSLPENFQLAASYVGTRSIHQMAYVEANAGQTPGLGALGQPLYVLFGRTAETQVITPFNTANYNALQANLRRRLARGIQMTASYTYSKSIDFATDSDSTPLFNAVRYRSRNRAVSDFSRRHVFQSGLVADLPFGKNHRWLAGGWHISGVVSKYSGLPLTPTASATSLNAANNTQVADQIKPDVQTLGGVGPSATWFDTKAYAPVSQARFGTAGRNSLVGPGAANLDLSVSRSFAPREWLRFDLRVESFNLTNTPMFANPSGNASSGNFGHILATVGGAADSRVFRIGGKLIF
jgi:hypothetical protein